MYPNDFDRLVAGLVDQCINNYNGPSYRGAPQPAFKRCMINADRIPDNMRLKFLDCRDKSDDDGVIRYQVIFCTQEEFTDEDALIFRKEVKRVVDYLEHQLKLAGPIEKDIIIDYYVYCRDGEEYGKDEFSCIIEAPDALIERVNESTMYYFGFIGGEAGNYFDADYIEIYFGDDYKYHWREELHDSDDKAFDSEKEALDDAIATLTPDDRSEMVVSKDPDELYDKITLAGIKYWIEYGTNPYNTHRTEDMSLEEVTNKYDEYISKYDFAIVRSSDNDISAQENF